MKLSKKLLGLLVTATLVVGTSVTAFGATNSDVITALTNAGVDSSIISQAKSYLSTHTIDSAKLADAVTEIGIVKDAGVKNLSDYNALVKSNPTLAAKVAAAAKAAAADAGVTVTKSSDGTLTIKDGSGNVLATDSANNVFSGNLPATATNYGNILVLGAILAAAGAAGTVVVAKKREVVANN